MYAKAPSSPSPSSSSPSRPSSYAWQKQKAALKATLKAAFTYFKDVAKALPRMAKAKIRKVPQVKKAKERREVNWLLASSVRKVARSLGWRGFFICRGAS